MKKFTRTQVLIVATLSLILPFLGWIGLVKLGHLGTPGQPIAPPFNLSDRISTIEVNTSEEGERTARFHGWKPGAPELTGDAFLEEIERRREALPWIYSFLDVTSVTGVLWVAFGFAGQAVFMGRMVAQWRASEKAKSSVVPPVFWWLSLLGSSMLMVYFLWRKEIVGFLGQSTGWFIYIRNLWFIYGKANR
ncbi:MAG: lipid-A-disaccharide synthase N-terminal domain-containing protein [Verrucomicrobiales bacterium]|nr:lipid-A-disaccharide synthase N-terminal domain-containing protein [Verrucomicrobiales bacterium]